jgi:PAS domain S-box-containing protein
MGALMRAHAWEETPLGPPANWPQGLRTAVRLLLNTGHPMYIFWSAEGVCLYNDAYRKSIGPERHPGSLGRPVREVWQEIWPIIGPQIDQVMDGRGATWDVDALVPITRNGRREDVYWTYSYSPIHDEKSPGGVGGVLVVCTETTELVRTQQATAAREKHYRNLFQQMPGFVAVVMGPDHIYEYVNDGYVTISGPRGFVGRPVRDVFPEPGFQALAESLDEVYLTGVPFATNAIPIRLTYDEHERYIDLRFQPIHDVSDTVVGILVGGHDVTERVRAESALKILNAELEQRVVRAVAEQTRTEEALRHAQKLDALGQLTGGVAHDFNNLLTIITSSVGFLKREDLPKERRLRYVDAISDTANRATKLTGQLLAFARRQNLKPETFDVSGSVVTIADMLKTITGSRVRVVTLIPSDPCLVHADPAQLDTAIINMAINGRDAMGGEGTLTLEVGSTFGIPATAGAEAVDGSFVFLSLSDTGSGIPTDKLSRVFEPFYTTKPMGQGTGLGLSQVFGFAKQSGGEVRAASEPGVGSVFTLYLPRASHASVADHALIHDDAPVGGGRLRVLLVEDNEDLRAFSTQALKELGCEVVAAADGMAALAELQTDAWRFDVVFSDVVMPGMNGVELGQQVRQKYPALPIVLTSGYSHILSEKGTQGFELLQKPYSLQDLSRELRKAIARRHALPHSPD